MPQDDPLSSDDTISFWEWLKDFTYGEFHLFVLGFYSGFVAIRPRRRQVPRGPGLPEGDSWYHRGGYVLGYLTKAAVIIALGLDNYV